MCTCFSYFCFICSEHSYPELQEILLSTSAPSLSSPTHLPQVNIKSNYWNCRNAVTFLKWNCMHDNCLSDSKSNFSPLLFFSSTQELAPSGQYRLAWLLRPASLCPRLPLQHPAALQQLLSSPVCTAFSDEPIFIFFPLAALLPLLCSDQRTTQIFFVLHFNFFPHVASAPCSLNYWTFHSSILSVSVPVGAYQMWQIPCVHLLLILFQVPLTWQPNLRVSSLVVPVGSWPRLLLTTRCWSLLLPLLKTNQTLTSSSTMSQRSAAHASLPL